MKVKNTLIVAIVVLLAGACKKPAGEGGNSSIRGKIRVEDWNTAFTVKNGEYDGADIDVYIIYGNQVSYGDRIRSTYTGDFEFKFLNKGKYKVYVYSKDKTLHSQSGDTAFVKEIEITGKKQTKTLDPFIIYE